MLPEIAVPVGSSEAPHNEADDETWNFSTLVALVRAGAKFENGKLVEAPRRRNDREGSRLTTMRQRTASSSDAYVFIGARPHRAVSGA
jgi:hypothetical protein